MAQQHFYSRVPARISMFNRAEGYDTFACSEGLEREYIEGEIGSVFEQKLTAQESELMREGKLTPVFCQQTADDGRLVQSCIRFIPTDYTGERSSYYIHSLVLDADETQKALYSVDNASFNQELFDVDLASFDITSSTARPDDAYPCKAYAAPELLAPDFLATKYNSQMMKRMIFAVLGSVLGKYKSVYYLIPPSGDLSLAALKFSTALLEILPYHIRSRISFATRQSDATRFPNVKLKCITPDVPEIQVAKGVTVNFIRGNVVGIRDDEVGANISLVEFFYSLLTNDALRRDFIEFADGLVKVEPSIGAMNFKSLSDIVFLFRVGYPLVEEKAVLTNDDKVYDYFALCEKYRAALSDERREKGARSLGRYPANRQNIPPKTYAKIRKLYFDETAAVRHIILGVMLEQLHADETREKPFAFVKEVYSFEDGATRADIIDHLVRIFYGGFLQPQIIDFFDQIFDEAAESCRELIVEKFLLALRTKGTGELVMSFLEKHYDALTLASRDLFYHTVGENMLEGDKTALDVIALSERLLARETEDYRAEILRRVCSLIHEDQQRKGTHHAAKTVAAAEGFLAAGVLDKILGEWNEQKIFREYVNALSYGTLTERTDKFLATALRLQGNEDRQIALAQFAASSFGQRPVTADITEINAVLETVNATAGKSEISAFAEKYYTDAITPVALAAIDNVFVPPFLMGEAERAANYVKKHPEIENYPRVATLKNYIGAKNAAIRSNERSFGIYYAKLYCEGEIATDIAAYMREDIIESDALAENPTRVLVRVLTYVMEFSDAHFMKVYDEATTELAAKYDAKSREQNYRQRYFEAESTILCNILKAGCVIVDTEPYDEIVAILCTGKSGLDSMLKIYLDKWESSGNEMLKRIVAEIKPETSRFHEACAAPLTYQRAAEAVAAGIQQSVDGAKKQIKTVWDFFDLICVTADKVYRKGKEIWSRVYATAKNVYAKVRDFLIRAYRVASDVYRKVKAFCIRVWQVSSKYWREKIKPVLVRVWNFLTKFWREKALPFLRKVWQATLKALRALGRFFKNIFYWIDDAFLHLKEAFINLKFSIKNMKR